MNDDVDPATATAGAAPFQPPVTAVVSEQPRRMRTTLLLSAVPAAAVAALTAAPLAAAIRIGATVGTPDAVIVLADECHAAIATGALNTLKWPLCGGD